jgi:hypothetical protein
MQLLLPERGAAMTDQLTTLRAEVERLRDAGKMWLAASLPDDSRMAVHARRQAFKEVLDLIDKQREGQ